MEYQPVIERTDIILSEDKTTATLKIIAKPGNGGDLIVTANGKLCTKTDENTYEIVANKNGKAFILVREVGGSSANKEIEITGIERTKCILTYDANGGANAPINEEFYEGSTVTISPTQLTRDGYRFLGWSEEKDATEATYRPGGIYAKGVSTTLYAIWKNSTLQTIPTVTMANYVYGETPSTPQISANPANGTVTYYYATGNTEVGTIWSSSVKLDAGTYYMYATITDMEDYDDVTTSTISFNVAKAKGSIKWSKSSIGVTLVNTNFENMLTKTGDGVVNYSSSNESVATINSNEIVEVKGVGTTTIKATITDTTNYTYPTKTVSYQLTVTKANITTAKVEMPSYTYGETPSTPNIIGNEGNGTVTYYYSKNSSNSGGTVWDETNPPSLNAGIYYMYATIAETEKYNKFTTSDFSFTVAKASGTIKFSREKISLTNADETLVNELTNTGDGQVSYKSSNTSVATVDASGKVTIIEKGNAAITAEVVDGVNYTYPNKTVSYELEITKATPYLMSKDLSALSYVLGYGRNGCSSTYTASSIKTVTFKNTKTVPQNAVASWNVSADGKRSVKAWLVRNSEDSSLYDMYIGADLSAGEKIVASSDCTALFMYHSSLTEVNGLELLDMSRVSSTRAMFWECALGKIDLSSWNTPNLTNIQDMFAYNKSLIELNMNINVSKVTNAHGVFFECLSLNKLTLGDFNLSNARDMDYMIYNCRTLKSIDGKITTKNATSMVQFFYQCKNLESIDLSGFKTSNVTSMSSMFAECTSLKSLDLSTFSTSNVTDMARMFYYCDSLTELDLSNFDTSKVTDMHEMFYDSDNLAVLKLGEKFNQLNGANMFSRCPNLKTMITLRTEPMTLVTSTYLSNSCILYVPNETAKLAFEKGENYLEVFGSSSKDTTREDGSTNINRIRTVAELN